MTGDVLFGRASTAAVGLRPRVIAALSARGRRGVPDPPTEHCRTQRRGGEPRDGRAAAFSSCERRHPGGIFGEESRGMGERPLRSADVKRSVVSGACVDMHIILVEYVRGVS
jgi:hypothetical protein